MTEHELHEEIMKRADEYQPTLRSRPRDLAEDLAFCMVCTENGIGVEKVPTTLVTEEMVEFLNPGAPEPLEYDDGSDQ